jgi:hypothetical protein
MAIHAVVTIQRLDGGLVLAPERYDPRRTQNRTLGPLIGELVGISRWTVSPKNGDTSMECQVVDTSDARNGWIRNKKTPVGINEIGSTKKQIQAGDVIISRLRPYLRQVGYVDEAIEHKGRILVASTEFYVLRAQDSESIAFLVPFLLSEGIQSILSLSQEGGHHPRFTQQTLERLVVPMKVVEKRVALSQTVERAAELMRRSERALLEAWESIDLP